MGSSNTTPSRMEGGGPTHDPQPRRTFEKCGGLCCIFDATRRHSIPILTYGIEVLVVLDSDIRRLQLGLSTLIRLSPLAISD